MSRRDRDLALAHAFALGLLHGPAELLPVSSSAHVAMAPWLLRRGRTTGDRELEKALEVALHAGTALALLVVLRREVLDTVRTLDRRRVALHVVASLPPSAVGFMLERPIEQRLGTPATTAAGLAAGSVALLAADRSPARRRAASATVTDGAWLGVAQTCALVPGVSRSGATLAALRARGFRRADAARLSREVALPIIAGATALKSARLARRRVPPADVAPLVVGAAAAFVSTVLARGLIGRLERDRPLAPYALYRLLLAAVIAIRARSPDTSTSAPAGDGQY